MWLCISICNSKRRRKRHYIRICVTLWHNLELRVALGVLFLDQGHVTLLWLACVTQVALNCQFCLSLLSLGLQVSHHAHIMLNLTR